MKVISGPSDVCVCGHVKNFHISIYQPPYRREPVRLWSLTGCAQCRCPRYLDRKSWNPFTRLWRYFLALEMN
jgi:hypothetical protein